MAQIVTKVAQKVATVGFISKVVFSNKVAEKLDSLGGRGIVCAYHHAAAGLNPNHTKYAFSICLILWEQGENKQKEAGISPIFF